MRRYLFEFDEEDKNCLSAQLMDTELRIDSEYSEKLKYKESNNDYDVSKTNYYDKIDDNGDEMYDHDTEPDLLTQRNIMETPGMFWFLTIVITLGVQAIVQYIWGNKIVDSLFGNSYGSGLEDIGINLAIWLGPWGFVICAILGTFLYNTLCSRNRDGYQYQWYNYVLSTIVSFASSAAYVIVIMLITIAIIVMIAALIVYVVYNMLS